MEIDRTDLGDGRVALRFAGTLDVGHAAGLRRRVLDLLSSRPRAVDFDLSGVDAIDGSTSALLLALRTALARRGTRVELVGAAEGVARILALYGSDEPKRSLHEAPRPASVLEQIGRETRSLLESVQGSLDYVGDIAAALGTALRRPASVNWSDVTRVMERAGADGFPIVVMITFLMGMVTAFQAAVQLRQFGADIFVADLVALSVTRELGPLMTAIIVAGRSGAAFSAEIGTMAVSEEIDALQTLKLSPYGFLVFPRVIALVLVVPLLTLIGDLCGILGGLAVSMLRLDLTPHAYLQRSQQALDVWDVASGVLKSVFFGLAVALVACRRGLATRGGAAGVGLSTTSAVVTSLFALVVLDALFTVLFNLFDL